jgi:hypothetical protein
MPLSRGHAVSLMGMTQLVIGAAFGYIVAHMVLYGTRHSVAWLRRDEVQQRLRALASAPGPAVASGLVKYGAMIGAGAALIALGAWAVSDYYAAKSARTAATASVPDAPMPAPAARPPSTEEVAVQAAPHQAPASAADAAVDPYADPAFKVQRSARRAGDPSSLTQKLVRRSEARARGELLAETREHAARSQYDCEAADRAEKYLKADLDVWGFSAWQVKYFPVEGYKGATLAQCRDIKSVVDPAELDLRSTVAQGRHS